MGICGPSRTTRFTRPVWYFRVAASARHILAGVACPKTPPPTPPLQVEALGTQHRQALEAEKRRVVAERRVEETLQLESQHRHLAEVTRSHREQVRPPPPKALTIDREWDPSPPSGTERRRHITPCVPVCGYLQSE